MSELLRVENLSTVFNSQGNLWSKPRQKTRAVNDVSLILEQGKTLGLVGESGCGKSTLAKTILRLYPATTGHIYLKGQDITHVQDETLRKVRKQMQIVFQDPYASLNPRMRVANIIGEPLWVQQEVTHKREMLRRVEALLEQVGLAKDAMQKLPHEFSGGQRQRIGIARALALNPALVICDEPVSALDVSIQSQILNLLIDLQQEHHIGYLFISHDLRVVEHISDTVAVMYLGKLMEVTSSKALYAQPLHPYTQMLFSATLTHTSKGDKKLKIPVGEIPSPANPPSGCVFRTRCPIAIADCKKIVPELREVKPNHTVACIRV